MYISSFIHLLSTKIWLKNWRENYSPFAVVLSQKLAKCALMDTRAGCAFIKFSSGHTGGCHLLPNWNNPNDTIPQKSALDPTHPPIYLHIPYKRLMQMLEAEGMASLTLCSMLWLIIEFSSFWAVPSPSNSCSAILSLYSLFLFLCFQ